MSPSRRPPASLAGRAIRTGAGRFLGPNLVPRHSGFDWLGVAENGQVLGGAEHLDAARDAWLAADVAEALQREDHLVHGRRGEREMVLHVVLGRGTAVDAGIGVDEGQVLPLPL